jgi:hypothetical protein
MTYDSGADPKIDPMLDTGMVPAAVEGATGSSSTMSLLWSTLPLAHTSLNEEDGPRTFR